VKTRSVQEWFLLLQEKNDLAIAKQVAAELPSFTTPRGDHEHLLALFTAIRLDQMAKEVGAMFEPKEET
jgi:hypothetical protein